MHATGFVCGSPKQASRVHLRPPMRSFAAPPFWNHCFYCAKWCFLRCPETKFPHCFQIFSGFSKCHFGGRRGRFFAVRKNFCFLRVFPVCALPGAVQEVVGRETLQNKGFRSNFALWCLVHLRWARCIALMLQYIFDTNFSGSHKFVFFGSSDFWPNWFCKAKNGLGLQNWGDFQNDVFPILPGRGPICEFLARFRFCSCVAVWVRFGPLPEICLRLRCGWFFPSFPVFFFRHRFCEFEKGSFENPLSSFRVLLFCFFSSWAWVDATLHVCFGAVCPKPFFSFCFFCLSVYKNIVFPPEKGYFCSFLCVALSFSLVSFTSPFHSLSLSFSCFFFFVLPCSFVYFLWPSLFFAVLSCLVSLLLFHDNNNIKMLNVKGFFSSILSVSFGFLVFLVSPIPFSYLCFSLFRFCVLVNMNVFVFLKQTISTTQILVLHFVKHYRFYWGPFCRQNFGWCVKTR